MLDRCAKEPEFIMGILHETPERPNQFVLYELWRGTRAEFDATQWNLPILEWGSNLTGLKQS